MPDIIQLLPDHVANQIAAGEVVQRPASVVKELLENAIDADATEIKLIIKDAGKSLIQVIDNGMGMSETDARLAFERHATSKIKAADDLFNLTTKGFRGEALASIVAISHVELKTKPENRELGTQIKLEGSKVIAQNVVSTPTGTSIAVKHLFYNIPARRNFLKSNSVESRHIIDEFQRVALAHPNISFSFFHNEGELFNLKPTNLRQRIVAIFGGKTNEKLVPISEETDIVKIEGFISKPNFAKKKRGEQFFFVNGRFIKHGYLHHAVMSAFDGLLAQGYHPSYFLYLRVPATTLDVNIHPTKTEVKFDNEHALYAIIRSTIKHSLGQYNVAPILDFEKDATLEVPYDYKEKNAPAPKIEVDPSFNPFEQNTKISSSSYKKEENTDWNSLYVNVKNDALAVENIEVEVQEVSKELFDDHPVIRKSKTFQVHQKYILSVIKSGIVLIDQHLAHQRILYEEFLRKITLDEAASQQLLFPVELNFTSIEIQLIKEIQTDLESIGFQFSSMGPKTICIKGIPVLSRESDVAPIFEELLENIRHDIPETSFSHMDTIAKSLAKSLAIKNGVKLEPLEQEELLEKLFTCKEPNHSPYGKNTFITLPLEEIQLKFDH
ncbi:MAG: DNA mismatch repair endonuclease MutL [Flavobacteriaceae bacterium]|nr:DNA mismatch repair endonuclease MutL [Flavobacteriaceae bacterium]